MLFVFERYVSLVNSRHYDSKGQPGGDWNSGLVPHPTGPHFASTPETRKYEAIKPRVRPLSQRRSNRRLVFRAHRT